MNTSTISNAPPTLANKHRPQSSLDFSKAYQAQLAWSQRKVQERTAILSRMRYLLVENRHRIASLVAEHSNARQDFRETIASELMPLADAAKWLHKNAKKILAPRYIDAGKTPFWLGRLRSTIHRVPYGLVMIIGTWNYPVLLSGVQMFQALAAGNAVVLKPAPGSEPVTRLLVDLLIEAGVPEGLMVLLDSSVAAAQEAIQTGIDKVVMTGSSPSGRAVLRQLADTLTPSVMELSGCDAMYVLPGADMHRVCDLLLFGLRLNGGATCMAPRRIFIPRKSSEVFHRLLSQRLAETQQADWSAKLPSSTYHRLWDGVEEAVERGAQIFFGPANRSPLAPPADSNASVDCGYVILTEVTSDMQLCSQDIFAPVALIVPVDDWSDALRADSQCPYALSASVFGPMEDALRIMKFVSAGMVTINDLIVPSADPNLPFGGRGESGFGSTRGREGLLEMTYPKVVSVRLGSWLPHAKLPDPADEQLLDGLLQFSHHRNWRVRWTGCVQAIKAIMAQRKRAQHANDTD